MNRLVLKCPYPITAVILLIFAWVVIGRLARGVDAIVPLALAAAVVWPLATFVFVYLWPRITVGGFRRAILNRGFGAGPIPVNTLYAVPERPSGSASSGGLMAVGTDDLLYLGGWLDAQAGPRVLHVPEMRGRYYSLQFTDPESGSNFAYVGTRTTGTDAGEFLVCERGWTGRVPDGMPRIDMPHRTALVIGRVFAADDDDRRAAYVLATQIQLRRPAPNPDDQRWLSSGVSSLSTGSAAFRPAECGSVTPPCSSQVSAEKVCRRRSSPISADLQGID